MTKISYKNTSGKEALFQLMVSEGLVWSYLRGVPEKNITVVGRKLAVEDSCSHRGGQEAERTIGKG